MLKILVTGPESSGKTTLTQALHDSYHSLPVPEVARLILEQRGGSYEERDLVDFARKQVEMERDVTEGFDFPVVFCDTGPEVILIWALEKFGRADQRIRAAVESANYDAVLLCYPDLAWQPDPLREHPDLEDRYRLFNQYAALIDERYGEPVLVVRGKDRLAQAREFLNRCFPALQAFARDADTVVNAGHPEAE